MGNTSFELSNERIDIQIIPVYFAIFSVKFQTSRALSRAGSDNGLPPYQQRLISD
jgi:hypothetical protein